MKIQVVNKGHQPLPAYATKQSAGMDLRANIDEPIVLHPMERRLIPTGLHIALPEGYEAQVRPRSGLALKKVLQCSILLGPSMPTIVARWVYCSSIFRKKILSLTMVSVLPRWSLPVMSRESLLRWKSLTKPNVVKAVTDTQAWYSAYAN